MYKLKLETINKVLNYLATKPYTEVVGLINELQQAQEIKDENTNKKQ